MTATDAAIHRCDECGTWCLGAKPCTTCQIQNARTTELRGGAWVPRAGVLVWQPSRSAAA